MKRRLGPYPDEPQRLSASVTKAETRIATTRPSARGPIRPSNTQPIGTTVEGPKPDDGFLDHPSLTKPLELRLTVKKAAEAVNCCQETIRRAYLSNQLKVERIGRRSVRIPVSELEEWLAKGGPTRAA